MSLQQRFKDYYLKCRPVLHSIPDRKQEVLIASELARILQCRREIPAPYNLGRIDILGQHYLIEAKYEGSTNEKHAIGQLLLYAYSMQFKGNLGIAIIGNSGAVHPGIHKFCIDNNIYIFYYNTNVLRWGIINEPVGNCKLL